MNILIIVIVYGFDSCFGSNGFIWDKIQKNFVPIFSINQFRLFYNEILNKSRQNEMHNFGGQELHFVYFDVMHRFVLLSTNCPIEL